MTPLQKYAAKKDRDKKTYPFSRFLTSPEALGALRATTGGARGASIGGLAGGAAGAIVGGVGGAVAPAISRVINARAQMGRARDNQRGVTASERRVLKALRAKKSGRKGSTNPISRALTSIPLAAVIGGTGGSITGALMSKRRLAGALIGGGLGSVGGGAGAAINRIISARASRGRANKKQKGGIGSSDAKVIKALRAYEKRKKSK